MKECKAYGLSACELRRQWHHMGFLQDIPDEKWRRIMQWCKDHASEGQFLASHNTSWYFEHESDAMMFSLMWL
jgi:hypothetical protein